MPDKRHGGAYDRGSADAYYRRPCKPHYFKGKTYLSEKVTNLTPDEIADYRKGYSDQIASNDFKDWGEWEEDWDWGREKD